MPCLSRLSLGNLGLGLAEGDGAAGMMKPELTLREAASAPGAQNVAAASSITMLLKSVFAVFIIFGGEFCLSLTGR